MSRIKEAIRDVESGVPLDLKRLAVLQAFELARADEVFANEMIELMQELTQVRYDRLKSIKIGPSGVTEAEFFRPAAETEVSGD